MKNTFKVLGIAAIVAAIAFTFTACGDSDSGGGTIAVTGITLNKTTLSLDVDDTDTLIATVAPPKAANRKVTWESNKTEVASVSQGGLVTAKAAGTATISVTAEDGNFSAICDVTVVPPTTPETLAQKLASLPPNAPASPHRVKVLIAEGDLNYPANQFFLMKTALLNAPDKYVFLDISSSAINEIPYEALSTELHPEDPDNYEHDGCPTLCGIQIPDGVTRINWNAFASCVNLVSLNIPASVTYLGGGMSGCGFTSFVIPDTVTEATEWFLTDNNNLESVTIGKGLTRIEEGFLANNVKLASVTIPSTITYIGSLAFTGNESLASVTIPSNVTYIGSWAFAGNKSLASIIIPSKVTSIGDGVFNGCTSLNSVTFQGTISADNIANDAFEDIGDLRAKYIAGGNGTYTRAPSGTTWTKQ